MFNNSIKSAVMRVIKERIAAVQQEHDAEIESEVTRHKNRLETLDFEHTANKQNITTKHVNSILGKIL